MLGIFAVVTMPAERHDGQACGNAAASLREPVRCPVKSEYGTIALKMCFGELVARNDPKAQESRSERPIIRGHRHAASVRQTYSSVAPDYLRLMSAVSEGAVSWIEQRRVAPPHKLGRRCSDSLSAYAGDLLPICWGRGSTIRPSSSLAPPARA
jgi:hypothetical protein